MKTFYDMRGKFNAHEPKDFVPLQARVIKEIVFMI